MATLEEYRQSVKAKVRESESSSSSFAMSDEDYDRFIKTALRKYSKDRPRYIVTDITGASTPYYLINDSNFPNFTEGFSDVTRIESNAADISQDESPDYIDRDSWEFYRNTSGLYLRLKNASPNSSDIIRVEYTAPHTINGLDGEDTDTVPFNNFEAVVYWAASEALQALASRMAGVLDPSIRSDVVNYRSKSREYSIRAEEYRKFYREWIEESSRYTSLIQSVESGYSFGKRQPFLIH